MKDNPVSTGVAGAAMTAAGIAIAGPAVLGARVIAGGVGAGANYGAQNLFGKNPTDLLDPGIAGFCRLCHGGCRWLGAVFEFRISMVPAPTVANG